MATKKTNSQLETEPQDPTPEPQDPTPEPPAPTPAPQASVPPQWVMPRQKQVERQNGGESPMSAYYPRVIGGICEFCGVLDPNVESKHQYKLCPHYRGMQLQCTYCPQAKDKDEVIYHSNMQIAEHPDNPNKLVVWCNSYECSKKHRERFQNAT